MQVAGKMTSQAAKSQIHFSGESPCAKFVPNAFRASLCSSCSKLISKHKSEAVDESVVEAALEHLVESIPSQVLPTDDRRAALFLGGYKAAINSKFLTEHHANVLTAAGGLATFFGPKYERAISACKAQGVEYFQLDWVDSVEQNVKDEDLKAAVLFVEKSRLEGHSVLVHCAQGKSRSATVCIAYLMATQDMSMDAALMFVQQKRNMAQPNPGFLKALKLFESSQGLSELRDQLAQK